MPRFHVQGIQVRVLPRHAAKLHLSSLANGIAGLANGRGDFTRLGKFCLNRPKKQTQDSVVSESPTLVGEVRHYQSLYSGLNLKPGMADPQQKTQVSCQPSKNWEHEEIRILKHFEDENWRPLVTPFTMSLAKQADHLCLALETHRSKFQ